MALWTIHAAYDPDRGLVVDGYSKLVKCILRDHGWVKLPQVR